MKKLDNWLTKKNWATISGYLSAVDDVYEDVQNYNHLPEDFKASLGLVHRINRTICNFAFASSLSKSEYKEVYGKRRPKILTLDDV